MIVRFNERALAALGFDAPTLAALRHLLHQTGAVLGAPTLPDVVEAQAQQADAGVLVAQFAELSKDIEALRARIENASDVAELRKDVEALRIAIENNADSAEQRKRQLAQDIESAFPAAPADWEHPGKIGAASPNTGAFSTLTTAAKTQLNPVDADVELKPTGAGKVVVSPITAGTIDNMALGATTPQTATVTTLSTTSSETIGANVVAPIGTLSPVSYFAGYAATAQYRLIAAHPGAGLLGWGSDGANSMIFGRASAEDGTVGAVWATLDATGYVVTSGFGCNGKAAQGPAASGGTLAGVISALVANGILSS